MHGGLYFVSQREDTSFALYNSPNGIYFNLKQRSFICLQIFFNFF